MSFVKTIVRSIPFVCSCELTCSSSLRTRKMFIGIQLHSTTPATVRDAGLSPDGLRLDARIPLLAPLAEFLLALARRGRVFGLFRGGRLSGTDEVGVDDGGPDFPDRVEGDLRVE